MPNWKEVLEEIQTEGKKGVPNALNIIRRKYLSEIHKKTGRNVIAYYSGWLQRSNAIDVIVNDKDKNAFMLNIHKLDRTKGLDLILHTPGGDLAATESIVDYLNQMFGNNVRAIIPQISMSAGTMMALSCKEIGVSILDMEEDNDLQDLILTVHHSFMHTFGHSTATKIVENHLGVAYVESLPIQIPIQAQQAQRT